MMIKDIKTIEYLENGYFSKIRELMENKPFLPMYSIIRLFYKDQKRWCGNPNKAVRFWIYERANELQKGGIK